MDVAASGTNPLMSVGFPLPGSSIASPSRLPYIGRTDGKVFWLASMAASSRNVSPGPTREKKTAKTGLENSSEMCWGVIQDARIRWI